MDHESPILEARFAKNNNAQNPRTRCNNTADETHHSNDHAWFVTESPTRSDQIHLHENRYLSDSIEETKRRMFERGRVLDCGIGMETKQINYGGLRVHYLPGSIILSRPSV